MLGARGPQPKPRALRVLSGNASHRPLPEEPQPRAILPDRPKGMSARARAVWDDLAPRLQRIDLITEIDGAQFVDLCELQASLEAIRRSRRGKAFTVKLKNGPEMAAPLVTLELKVIKELRALRQSFGLAASYRVNLAPKRGGGDEGDDVDG